ncbi:MAG: glycerophosphodiester phosphodiesterase [Thermomicrobiales bacterium]
MIIHGHRGARFEAPENTIPGFRYAVELGLRAIEFDIHMTSDGQLVVIHDATVDRTTNGTGAVADMTFDQIRALDARSIFPDWPEPCIVPTFAEVMDVIGHFESLEIEIKTGLPERLDVIVPKILAELERRGYPESATLTSFDVYALELVQRLRPSHARGYIGKWDSPAFLETAKRLGAVRAGIPNMTGSAEIVRAAQDEGIVVTGWPCNTREEFDTLMSWNVDYLCSDAPTTILGFLNEK